MHMHPLPLRKTGTRATLYLGNTVLCSDWPPCTSSTDTEGCVVIRRGLNSPQLALGCVDRRCMQLTPTFAVRIVQMRYRHWPRSALLTVAHQTIPATVDQEAQQEQRPGLSRLKSYETPQRPSVSHGSIHYKRRKRTDPTLRMEQANGYGYLAGALSSGEAPLAALVLNGVSADQKGSYLIKRLLLLLLAWCEASWGTACQS